LRRRRVLLLIPEEKKEEKAVLEFVEVSASSVLFHAKRKKEVHGTAAAAAVSYLRKTDVTEE
jgi:hypothetical protein